MSKKKKLKKLVSLNLYLEVDEKMDTTRLKKMLANMLDVKLLKQLEKEVTLLPNLPKPPIKDIIDRIDINIINRAIHVSEEPPNGYQARIWGKSF